MIVSVFSAALDLDTYPLRNLIRPRCAEPGRGKPVLIMHISFLANMHNEGKVRGSTIGEYVAYRDDLVV